MRVIGIITAKGENIDFVEASPDPECDRFALIELVAQVEPRLHRRVVAEMNRLVQVLEAVDVSEGEALSPPARAAPLRPGN